MAAPLEGIFRSVEELLLGVVVIVLVSMFGGIALAGGLRLRGLRWTWSGVLLLGALLLSHWSLSLAAAGVGVCTVGALAGMAWQSSDLMAGGDHAQVARARVGVLALGQRVVNRWQQSRQGWVHNGCLAVGRDERGQRVLIPAGGASGSHTLILGATGSGKTCAEAWIAGRLIEHGHGAIVVDPKGDRLLRAELHGAAQRMGVPFLEWTPQGPLAYNPYAHGSDSEIADKALAGETFTEPHYLRQAQRYLGHAVRTMRAAQLPVTAALLMAHMDPFQLEATARSLPQEQAAKVQEYVDCLSERSKRDLAGVRDRLSILAESDIARWLDPQQADGAIDLRAAVATRAVAYFCLEADRRPLLAQMLAASVVSDLVTLAADRHQDPIATVVVVDEFSAVGAGLIARLFARARSAGMSLVLATQELADLAAVGQGALRDQAIGSVGAVLAYRQSVPDSAELVAAIAGTRPAWIASQQVIRGLLGHGPFGRGSRTRGHEPEIHPSHIKRLGAGQAVVITPGSGRRPAIADMCHPREAHPPGGGPA